MPVHRVVAAIDTASNHYDGYAAGDPLALVTEQAGAPGPVVFAITADDTRAVLEKMWVVGNRKREDVHGRCWPPDVRSLSIGDVLLVYPPGYPRVGASEAFAVASVGFIAITAPRPRAWVRLEGSHATSRPAPAASPDAPSAEPASLNRQPL
jgi:hypothetical protein